MLIFNNFDEYQKIKMPESWAKRLHEEASKQKPKKTAKSKGCLQWKRAAALVAAFIVIVGATVALLRNPSILSGTDPMMQWTTESRDARMTTGANEHTIGSTTLVPTTFVYGTTAHNIHTPGTYNHMTYPDELGLTRLQETFTYEFHGSEIWITGYSGPKDVDSVLIYASIGNKTVTRVFNEVAPVGHSFSYIPPESRLSENNFILSMGNDGVVVDPSHPSLSSSDGIVYNKDGTRLVYFPNQRDVYTIPENVTSIAPKAFAFGGTYYGVRAILVDAENPAFTSIDEVLFSKDETELIHFPRQKTEYEYIIPEGVGMIRQYAFYNCAGIQKIMIPDSVTEIGAFTFYYCNNLSEISVASGTVIDEMAFYDCPPNLQITYR